MYKSIKVTFTAWQALTRLSAATGETRGRIIERLAAQEEDRVGTSERNKEGQIEGQSSSVQTKGSPFTAS